MKNPITFDNVISNRIFDNEWRDMTQEEREMALKQIKTFLLLTCRTNSEISKAINRMSISNLPENMGIFKRLNIEGYTAGQDYPSELNYIKQQIKRHC